VSASHDRDEQLDLARLRIQLAIDDYNSLLKEATECDNPPRRAQTLPNSMPSGGGPEESKSRSKQRAPPESERGKSAFSRFSSSLRRPPLKRQCSSRQQQVERSPSGLSEVDYCSRYVFPIAFVLFVVIYWIALIYYKLTS